MKGVEAETWWVWSVAMVGTDPNGIHGHNRKNPPPPSKKEHPKNPNSFLNRLEGLVLLEVASLFSK